MSAILQLKKEIELLKIQIKELNEENKELKLIDFINKNSIYSDEYKIKYITDYFNFINFLQLDEEIDKSIKLMKLLLLNSNELFIFYKQVCANEELKKELGLAFNDSNNKLIEMKDINIKKLCDYILGYILDGIAYYPNRVIDMDIDMDTFNEESKKVLIRIINSILRQLQSSSRNNHFKIIINKLI